jgi:hypothetical protein
VTAIANSDFTLPPNSPADNFARLGGTPTDWEELDNGSDDAKGFGIRDDVFHAERWTVVMRLFTFFYTNAVLVTHLLQNVR